MRHLILMIFFVWAVAYCGRAQGENWRSRTEKAAYIHGAVKEITDVMVYDIYSPPVASRTYAYITVAGYEALINENSHYLTLAGQLQGLTAVPQPDKNKTYSFTLAAVQAILNTGKNFVISEDRVEEYRKGVIAAFTAAGLPADVMTNSLAYGQQVAEHIIAWAAKDHYKEMKALPRYAVNEEDGSWKPTPPAYIKAIEPNWNRLRTFVIDSAEQFKPARPPRFSTDTNSVFYKNAVAVYKAGVDQPEEENAIANFWDCNPFKVNVKGHVMFATKKISPNGHWENITRLACNKAGADVVQTAEAYARLSVALADCFISCWDEKYRSRIIRPETYINQYIDESWVPALQTPPFPEYTSGHSVVSAASAVILTQLFGKEFAFADSTENEFSLPVRHFSSFEQAAQEAAISRFYGGIHYMPAITNGLTEGHEIGVFVSQKLKTRKEEIAAR